MCFLNQIQIIIHWYFFVSSSSFQPNLHISTPLPLLFQKHTHTVLQWTYIGLNNVDSVLDGDHISCLVALERTEIMSNEVTPFRTRGSLYSFLEITGNIKEHLSKNASYFEQFNRIFHFRTENWFSLTDSNVTGKNSKFTLETPCVMLNQYHMLREPGEHPG